MSNSIPTPPHTLQCRVKTIIKGKLTQLGAQSYAFLHRSKSMGLAQRKLCIGLEPQWDKKKDDSPVLTSPGAGRPAGLCFIQIRVEAQAAQLSGQGEIIWQWANGGYSDLYHLNRWHKSKQPGDKPCCPHGGLGSGLNAKFWYHHQNNSTASSPDPHWPRQASTNCLPALWRADLPIFLVALLHHLSASTGELCWPESTFGLHSWPDTKCQQ